MSAYAFQKATNTLKEGDVNFRAFLTRLRMSPIANYQTRLISPQTWNLTGPRNGWDLNPRAIDLNDENLFVGTVEMFDQSMVLLEQWLKEKGVEFDASYSAPKNTGREQGSKKQDYSAGAIFPDMVEVDELLWKEVTQRIESTISMDINFSDKMKNYAMRRESVTGVEIAQKGPEEFVRL
jgi:hypothetical protein